jgi:thioesterase domain-containing protein/acyl carrier protein
VGKSEADNTRLHAFIQSHAGAALKAEDIRRQLEGKLPRFMIPWEIHSVVCLPCLPSGKVDRARLAQDNVTVHSVGPALAEPVDALGLQLLRLWQGALGSTDIHMQDDFFAVGGDSLAAAVMFAGVQKFLGIDLPVSTLVEAPTVEMLAEKIRKSNWSERNLRLVALGLRGTRPPLYCVPGAGSEAIRFRDLSRYLGSDQPCFAFQPQGLDRRKPYLRTVEAIAARYLAILEEHQDLGPYYFCGASFGGVVAFEMARRLVAQGREVAFLGMIDTWGGDYPRPRKDLSWRKRLRLALQAFPTVANEKLGWPLITKGLPEWWKITRIKLDLALPRRRLSHAYHERFLYLRQAAYSARRRYKLRPFAGRIHLFRAEIQPRGDLFESDPLLGWSGMAAQGIEIHDLPGWHGSQLEEPNVRILAKTIAACLEGASAGLSLSSQIKLEG